MPICQYCHQKWTYIDTFKKLFRIKLFCPYCKEQNDLTPETRRKLSFSPIVILGSFVLLKVFNVTKPWYLLIILIMACVMFMMYPYVTQLSKTEEPLR